MATARTNSRDGAASRAMVECIKHNPSGCELQGAYCDTSNGFVPGEITEADQAAYEAALAGAARHRANTSAGRRAQAGCCARFTRSSGHPEQHRCRLRGEPAAGQQPGA